MSEKQEPTPPKRDPFATLRKALKAHGMDFDAWTIRRTKSRGEAAALIATWRPPPRAKQLPLKAVPIDGLPTRRMRPEEHVASGAAVVRAIEDAERKARL